MPHRQQSIECNRERVAGCEGTRGWWQRSYECEWHCCEWREAIGAETTTSATSNHSIGGSCGGVDASGGDACVRAQALGTDPPGEERQCEAARTRREHVSPLVGTHDPSARIVHALAAEADPWPAGECMHCFGLRLELLVTNCGRSMFCKHTHTRNSADCLRFWRSPRTKSRNGKRWSRV